MNVDDVATVVVPPILKVSGVKTSGEIVCEKYFTGSTYSSEVNDCVIPVK